MARGDFFEPEEESLDMRRLGRTALWGAGAGLAVLIAVLSAQSEIGSRRVAAALSGLPPSLRPTPAATVPTDAQTARGSSSEPEPRRLAEAVKLLAADRDRLLARLEAIERNLDVTGSIPAQPSAAAPNAALGAPIVPGGLAAKGPPASVRAPPQQPLAQDAGVGESTVGKTEFGVDLGGETTLDGLRTVWNSAKTQHAAALEGLRPLIAVRETGKPGTIELRLVAGPLANAAAAARLCATLASSGAPCQPTTFEGQRLALR